jgi:ubiquinone/menaquinone biosynthesis C-methylase UbiE
LEIGCGTGSSIVDLAEQGAIVTGIDIDEDALIVARDRCTAYGLKASFMPLNGRQLAGTLQARSFDLIIFFACLEHMTIKERLESLRQAWDLLPSNGLLAIIETPNRLWFYDEHTSRLPLFHWLPNELAFYYSKMSKRENFRELYHEYFPETKQHFLRRGRGMSFHEIDLAIAPVSTLNVISSLEEFGKYPRGTSALGSEFKAIMQRIVPDIHTGFFDEYLDLTFKKG